MKNYEILRIDDLSMEDIKNCGFAIGDIAWMEIAEEQELDFAGLKLTRKKYFAIPVTVIGIKWDDEEHDIDEHDILIDVEYFADGQAVKRENLSIWSLYKTDERKEILSQMIREDNEAEERRLERDCSDVLINPNKTGIIIKLNSKGILPLKKEADDDSENIYQLTSSLAFEIDDMLDDICKEGRSEGELGSFGTYRSFLQPDEAQQ